MVRTTLGTHPFSISQCQRLVLPAADGTESAAWIPAIGDDEMSAVAFRLLLRRTRYPTVGDKLGWRMVGLPQTDELTDLRLSVEAAVYPFGPPESAFLRVPNAATS